MATITLKIGQNAAIDLANLNPKDLAAGLVNDLPFILSGDLAGMANLNQPVSSVADGTSGSLTYGLNPSWKLGGSPATFSLQANASATMTVRSKGHLLTYQNSFDKDQPSTNFDGKTGSIYIVTELSFNISGDLKANAPIGATGITASTTDSASAKFIVRNYRAFSPATTIQDALLQAIAGFTLPLHSGTVSNLADGDALYYEFDGALNLGFGVTYGVSGSVGGYSLSDISPTLQTIGQFVNISAKQGFTASANLGASLSFNWSRTFICFLERIKPDQGPGSARLHIMTGRDTMRSLELKANGGISNVTAPQITADAGALTQLLLQKATGKAAPNVPQSVTDAVNGEVQKYVGEANKWLTSLAKKVQANGQITLSLLFQNSTAFTTAFTWEFDLANNAFANAWTAAVQGDFVAALKTGAVELDAGSGFESVHTKNTKCTLTFFGLTFESLESYFSRSTMRYGGNGVFFLENQTGQLVSTSNKRGSTSTSIYFDATAKTGDGTIANNVEIQLHGVLTTTGDSDQLSRLGLLLQGIGSWVGGTSGQAVLDLGKTVKVLARQSDSPGASTVHIVYSMGALARLKSDEYVNGNQPRPPHMLDAANWDAYVAASNLIPTVPSSYLKTWIGNEFYTFYSSWEAFNRITNGFTDGNGVPGPQFKTDRHASIGLVTQSVAARLRSQPPFNGALSDQDCFELGSYFYAGQQYMNLCDDAHEVATGTGGISIDWSRLVKKLEQVIDADVDAWFGAVVLLSLVKSTNAVALAVEQNKVDPGSASSSTSATASIVVTIS